MLNQHELKPLVGKRIIVILIVANSGIVIGKNAISGILKGRPCKRNFNDYDLFAVKAARENAIIYINLKHWRGDNRYMVTFEPVNGLGQSATPILTITFNTS